MIQVGQKFSHINLLDSVQEIGTEDAFIYAALKYAEFNPYSSAAMLDKNIRNAGFKTRYKFYYKYDLPKQLKNELSTCGYVLIYFNNDYVKNFRTVEPDSVHIKALQLSYYFAQYIWALNPKTKFKIFSDLGPQSYYPAYAQLIQGVANGYHPKDIEFYINENLAAILNKTNFHDTETYKKLVEFRDKMFDNHGIDSGRLILCPEHREKLESIFSQKQGRGPSRFSYILNIFKSLLK